MSIIKSSSRNSSPRPDIALNLAQFANLCVSIEDLTKENIKLPANAVASGLGEVLARTPNGSNVDILVSTSLSMMKTRAVEDFSKALATSSEAKSIRLFLEDLDLTIENQLYRAYNSAVKLGDLNKTIKELQLKNLDAEKMAWQVITKETHNHLGLVWKKAYKMAERYPNYSAEDLFGWGWQGLRVALRNYDPTNFALSTYAMTRISGSIQDGVRSESAIPKRLGTWARKASKVEEELSQQLGRAPQIEELAEKLEADIKKIAVLPRLKSPASIEEMSYNGDGNPAMNNMIDHSDAPAQSCIQNEQRAAIDWALEQLDADEAEAVKLLVLEDVPTKEAKVITGADARQLRLRKNRGMAKMAELLDDFKESIIS